MYVLNTKQKAHIPTKEIWIITIVSFVRCDLQGFLSSLADYSFVSELCWLFCLFVLMLFDVWLVTGCHENFALRVSFQSCADYSFVSELCWLFCWFVCLFVLKLHEVCLVTGCHENFACRKKERIVFSNCQDKVDTLKLFYIRNHGSITP